MADGSNPLVDQAVLSGAQPSAIQGSMNAGQVTPGDTTATQPAQQQPQRMPMPGAGLPNIIQLLAGVLKPQKAPPPQPGQAPQRPNSRLDVFENFLGNFLNSFAAGMAQSGQRGAEGKGFAAAVQQPYQRGIQQQELGLEQQKVQAQTAEAQARVMAATAAPRFDPKTGSYIGNLTDTGYSQYLRGGQAAQTTAESRTNVANITAANRLDVEKAKVMVQAGQVSKIIPVTGPNGPAMEMLNKFGKSMGFVEGAIPPASLLPKTSSTIEYKQLDDGSIVALPKTTVTQPGIGGTAKGGGQGVGASVAVKDAQGNPLIGKGAVTSSTRTMVETAPKVLDLVQRVKGQINDLEKSGQLGPGMSRWNEFWSGKVGTDNPQFRAMMTNTTLLSTLLMRMHMGARGGQQIMQHFDEMIGAGHQSAANMKATLDQIELYATDVKGATPLPANYGKSNTAKGGSYSPNNPFAPK